MPDIRPGGPESMKGERKMIYKIILFRQLLFPMICLLTIALLLSEATAEPEKQFFMKCLRT